MSNISHETVKAQSDANTTSLVSNVSNVDVLHDNLSSEHENVSSLHVDNVSLIDNTGNVDEGYVTTDNFDLFEFTSTPNSLSNSNMSVSIEVTTKSHDELVEENVAHRSLQRGINNEKTDLLESTSTPNLLSNANMTASIEVTTKEHDELVKENVAHRSLQRGINNKKTHLLEFTSTPISLSNANMSVSIEVTKLHDELIEENVAHRSLQRGNNTEETHPKLHDTTAENVAQLENSSEETYPKLHDIVEKNVSHHIINKEETQENIFQHNIQRIINNEETHENITQNSNEEAHSDLLKVDPLPQKSIEPESNTSKLESDESVQQDYPLYSYGQDEFEIINLDQRNKTQKKSPDANKLNNDVKNYEIKHSENKTLEESSEELQTINIAPVKKLIDDEKKKVMQVMHESESKPFNNDPQVQFVNLPEKPSKRVFVNVTIAADSNNPYASKPFYVLSVSVPTDGDPNNLAGINIGLPNAPETLPLQMGGSTDSVPVQSQLSTIAPLPHWGGECECSCPCLDENSSFMDDDDDTIEPVIPPVAESSTLFNETNSTELYTETESSSEYFTESESTTDVFTTTSSDLSSTYGCPEVSTSLPPAPTILILEGRSLIRRWLSKRLTTSRLSRNNICMNLVTNKFLRDMYGAFAFN